uniref:Uncharacterized protein n=1 Tax=Vespula pensylvanica TaxID=30213 RepID=A0A834NXD8_VESPE|nr:hypothetical protein H0235_010622 [Vespula pensylvanica]
MCQRRRRGPPQRSCLLCPLEPRTNGTPFGAAGIIAAYGRSGIRAPLEYQGASWMRQPAMPPLQERLNGATGKPVFQNKRFRVSCILARQKHTNVFGKVSLEPFLSGYYVSAGRSSASLSKWQRALRNGVSLVERQKNGAPLQICKSTASGRTYIRRQRRRVAEEEEIDEEDEHRQSFPK